jgi:hypothetical protein
MTDKLKQELSKAFESYYQYLDEGTGCHNTIIELKTAIDLAIAEIEELEAERDNAKAGNKYQPTK